MMIRFQHVLRFILLLSLLLFLFLGWFGFNSNNHNGTIIIINNNNKKLQHLYVSGHRKILLASGIDFTPFLNRGHRHHHRHHHHRSQSHAPAHSQRSGTEIDPRFGVDKRLVPTGPNPLHH